MRYLQFICQNQTCCETGTESHGSQEDSRVAIYVNRSFISKEMKLKNISVFLCGLFFLLAAMGSANAALTTIGTANYNGSNYNLIWDDDNNSNSVVWLDYSKTGSWYTQTSWASGLNSTLTINLKDGYTVDWGTNSWRLPTTVDGYDSYGYDGTTTAGYNITSSEMGHLYYEELGNLGYVDKSGNVQSGYGLQNTGEFNNLIESWYWYWSGTGSADYQDGAWGFHLDHGFQSPSPYKNDDGYGLAVRSGQVSAVPEPTTILLLGSGIVGLVGARRKLKK